MSEVPGEACTLRGSSGGVPEKGRRSVYNIKSTHPVKNTKPIHSQQASLLIISPLVYSSLFSWGTAGSLPPAGALAQTHRGVGPCVQDKEVAQPARLAGLRGGLKIASWG